MVISTVVLNQMTVGDPTKIIQDLGLATLTLFSLLIIVFIGNEILGKDMESQTIYLILSKPIGGGQYLLGRFLGILTILYANMLAFSLMILFLNALYSHTLKWSLFISVGLTALEMGILLSFLILFFVFITPTLAPFLVLAVFVTGHTTTEVKTIFAHKHGFYHLFSIALYYLFPNFDLLSVQTEVVHNVHIPLSHLFYGIGYSLIIICLVLWISYLIFLNRDF